MLPISTSETPTWRVFFRSFGERLVKAGLPASSVYDARGKTTVPGYFRATKDWDILVIHEGVLLAAIEIKSQIWSKDTDFGKNVNNRCEEAIGNTRWISGKPTTKGYFPERRLSGGPILGFPDGAGRLLRVPRA